MTSDDIEENQEEEQVDETISTENVLNHPLNDEMKTSYINYAMSVIIGRALPDAQRWAKTRPPPSPLWDVRRRSDDRKEIQ